jgi:hypothetical protein
MSVIENFAELSAQEQQKFAEALIKTINSEKRFISEVDFKIDEVGTDEITGDLFINVSSTDTIEVRREAGWQARDEEDAKDDPGLDADYTEFIDDDVKKAFKSLSTVIDGYEVKVEIADVDEEETLEVEVDNYTHEDSGIGRYEYWGEIGYDSHPYVEVEGTIVKACTCYLTLWVAPAENLKEDFDDAELPTEVEVKKADLPDWDDADDLDQEEMLNNWLSDTFGFLHDGYAYEDVGDVIKVSNIAWVVD